MQFTGNLKFKLNIVKKGRIELVFCQNESDNFEIFVNLLILKCSYLPRSKLFNIYPSPTKIVAHLEYVLDTFYKTIKFQFTF